MMFSMDGSLGLEINGNQLLGGIITGEQITPVRKPSRSDNCIQLSGAHLGVRAIPDAWLGKLENRPMLEDLAHRLAEQ
jgi:hypothetical protein